MSDDGLVSHTIASFLDLPGGVRIAALHPDLAAYPGAYTAWTGWLRDHGIPPEHVVAMGPVMRDAQHRTVSAVCFAYRDGERVIGPHGFQKESRTVHLDHTPAPFPPGTIYLPATRYRGTTP